MQTKIFSAVTSISMILTLVVTTLSVIGIIVTGPYPAILVLLLIALIPIASKQYAKRMNSKNSNAQKSKHTSLVILNILCILIVMWIAFVILVDRVFPAIL